MKPLDPGGGVNDSSPGKKMTTTPATGTDSVPPKRMRSFAEFLSNEQKNRNILLVKMTRGSTSRDEVSIKPLNQEDISEFLFDIIKLKVEDCEGIALRTHKYDTKEIKLKKNVDPVPYIRIILVSFKDHYIMIRNQQYDKNHLQECAVLCS